MTKRLLCIFIAVFVCSNIMCKNQSMPSDYEMLKEEKALEESNKAIVMQIYEAKEKGEEFQVQVFKGLLAPNFVVHAPDHSEEFRPIELMMQVFPSKSFDNSIIGSRRLDPIIAEGDKVAFRYAIEAVQNGKKLHVDGMTIFRFEQGKIKEVWLLEDILGLFSQMGWELKPLKKE